MKLNVFFTIFFMITFINVKGQENNFYIKQITYQSDFDFIDFNDIDNIPMDRLSINMFNLKEGKYTIYCFERKKLGESKDNINSPLQSDYLLIKTDKGKIIESYYLPLSWREPPISNVILSSKKEIKISSKISTDIILFMPINDSGINILKQSYLFFKSR